ISNLNRLAPVGRVIFSIVNPPSFPMSSNLLPGPEWNSDKVKLLKGDPHSARRLTTSMTKGIRCGCTRGSMTSICNCCNLGQRRVNIFPFPLVRFSWEVPFLSIGSSALNETTPFGEQIIKVSSNGNDLRIGIRSPSNGQYDKCRRFNLDKFSFTAMSSSQMSLRSEFKASSWICGILKVASKQGSSISTLVQTGIVVSPDKISFHK